MKHFQFFLLFPVIVGGAWAQPPANRETAVAQTAPEQRRAELRLLLKASHDQEAQGEDQNLEKGPVNRHLSAQERADLRQQLRQQLRDSSPDRP